MTIEDRLRATTEAVTEAMRPVRSLDLRPDAAGAQAPAKRRLPRHPRRWPGWLIPLAAAMAVIAVAATLVAVRSLSAAGSGSRPTPATTSTAANGVPRYYVAFTPTGTSPGGAEEQNAFLADAKTGKRLATFKPPADAAFGGIAASSDGKTFVLDAVVSRALGPSGAEKFAREPASHVWYVLRLTPSAIHQPRLTRIPIASSFTNVGINGLAVSPDGAAIAIMFHANATPATKSSGPLTLRTYSLATGRLLRTWTAPASSSSTASSNEGLTWLDDGRTLAFTYPPFAVHQEVRTLNTARPGTSLLADSRPVFSVPGACMSLLMTSDGKSVVCGSFDPTCTGRRPELAAYSVATGKLEHLLYRYPGSCHFGTAKVLWAKSAALVIGLFEVSKPVTPYPPITNLVGVITPGKFTPLPFTQTGGYYQFPNTIAF